jgi:glycosyltransferase involved in cell wall biosynthesis
MDRALEIFLKKHRVQIVLGEYLHLFLDFVPLLDRLNIPYVVQGHGIDLSAALRNADTKKRYLQYRSAKAILTRCEFHRKRLIELGLPSELIHVNPGGVDIPATLTQRSESSRKRFLAVGRMVPKKGPLYLLEAFRQAALEDAEITLDYVGGGELLEAARQYVDATEMGGRIRIHGNVTEEFKQALWQECGVFLQHSIVDDVTGDEEGLPAAIQEAMAAGMIVVGTYHSGIPEAIEHGLNGFLVREKDVVTLASTLIRICKLAKELEPMRQAAREKAALHYSWSSERDRILTAFQ